MSPTKKAAKKTAVVRKAVPRNENTSPALERGPRPLSQKAEAAVVSQQQEGLYVYGVIESRAGVTFGKSSIGGVSEDVSTVHYGDIAAEKIRSLLNADSSCKC